MAKSEQAGSRKAERSLTELKVGEEGIVTALAGGHGFQARLVGMGIRPGIRLEVRRNDGKGPVLVAVARARVALGRGMAAQVRMV